MSLFVRVFFPGEVALQPFLITRDQSLAFGPLISLGNFLTMFR